MTSEIKKYLVGGDLRSIANSWQLETLIKTQKDFDCLFHYLHSHDRLVVMRAADVLEKISRYHPEFLQKHTDQLLDYLMTAKHKEFKWHLAQLVPRLKLPLEKREYVVEILTRWASDSLESKIVRVNALQAIYDINLEYHDKEKELQQLILKLKEENIPSLNSRIRKLTST